MGSCMSTVGVGGGAPYIPSNDGGEDEFRLACEEGKVLGQGEFGAVKLCKSKTNTQQQGDLAVKILKKGMVFKDNTLYGALKPQVLQAECDILKTLGGKQYCLELMAIYETPKAIYVVTELCSGGEMGEYVAQYPELRTEDVSRIAYQLLSAVNHCDKHDIIHRDIKADNCMFVDNSPTAELRLIDFGCGVHDTKPGSSTDVTRHTTFAGSAFYISPEMFQRTYTSATDVWSVGVVLYVLVAGYPADDLQKAFNILQKKNRNLRTLPNLPSNLPDSYYEMLDKLLVYHYKSRHSAAELLSNDEFVQFDKLHEKKTKMLRSSKGKSRTASVHFVGSVERHGLVLDYKKFERAVTTLVATMLSQANLSRLLAVLEDKDKVHTAQLKVIPVKDLKSILLKNKQQECVDMIDNLPNASSYGDFAYHIALLKQFSRTNDPYSREQAKTQRSMSISAMTLPQMTSTEMSATNIHAPTTSNVVKQNGSVETGKPSRKPPRAQSVVVGKKSDLSTSFKTEVEELKRFKPAMTKLNETPPVSRGTTATSSLESLDEGEFGC